MDYLLSLGVTVVGLLASFTIGIFSQRSSRSYEMKKKRYEEFYVPFMQAWSKELGTAVFSKEIKDKQARLYTEVILPNSHLIGVDGNKQLFRASGSFFEEFIVMTNEEFEKDMDKLVIVLLKEAKTLARQLKYPDLPGILLDGLSGQNQGS